MRFSISILAAIAITVPIAVHAAEPNIQPGEWEYENTTTFEGDMDIPDQSETTTECITQEDIDDGLVQPDDTDMGECEIRDKQVGRDAMSYTMECTDASGGSMVMDARMEFMGDRASGTIEGRMESEMGTLRINTSMEGTRLGDC